MASGLSAMADARSRSSSSISPSLNVRTGLPTPPAVNSGGSPKRMMNSSLSCVSTVSLPTTATTTLAETSESSLSNEKSSLLNRHLLLPSPRVADFARDELLVHACQHGDSVVGGVLVQVAGVAPST